MNDLRMHNAYVLVGLVLMLVFLFYFVDPIGFYERLGLATLVVLALAKLISQLEECGWFRSNACSHLSSDCVDKQKIVNEDELPALLGEGWRVSVVLPSGKIVVEA